MDSLHLSCAIHHKHFEANLPEALADAALMCSNSFF